MSTALSPTDERDRHPLTAQFLRRKDESSAFSPNPAANTPVIGADIHFWYVDVDVREGSKAVHSATVIIETQQGQKTFSHQLVRPLGDQPGSFRFRWHAGSRETLLNATYIRIFKRDGTLIGQGYLAPGRPPVVHADYRVEFELAVSDAPV